MKKAIKVWNTATLFSLLMAIASCNGQTATSSSQPKITLPAGVSPQTMFRCSIKDKAGNLWFGTSGAGIYKYDGKGFTRYAEKEGLSNMPVYNIAQDIRGNIWVATDNGIFHSSGDQFIRLEIPGLGGSNDNSAMGIGNANTSNRKLQVYCVVCDKKGNIWFGTEDQGLWRYNGTTLTNFRCADSTWSEVPKGGSAGYPQKGLVQYLLEDKNGNIWVSAFGTCLNYYDGSAFHPVNVEHSRMHTLQMIEDRSGNIWIATRQDGVCRFNGKTIESFTEKDGVPDNNASSLYEDKNGKIWFGSLGRASTGGSGVRGLTVYDGKRFTAVSSKGMRNNQVWTVIGDNAGNIWAGTKEFGLFRYDGKTFTEFTIQR